MASLLQKIAIFTFTILISLTAKAQDFQGVITYQTKTTLDPNFGGNRFNEQQRAQFAERLRSQLEKEFTLSFTKTESIYKEVEKLEAQGNGGGRFAFFANRFGAGGNGAYKNITEDIYAIENELSGKRFLVKDKLPVLKWEVSNESKMIGDYIAFKATATRKIEDLGFGRGFGRGRQQRNNSEADANADNDSPEAPQEELITAWFTPQIPIGQGPSNYWGLPGLILEVSAGRTTILCTKIVLNPKEGVKVKVPSKGKEVTQKEYNEIVRKQIEEARERFGGGRRRGGGRFGGGE